MKKNHRLNTILIIALTLGFGFTLSVVNAGPPIAVTSAEPDEVVKATVPKTLTVTINGRGFDRKTDIQFCLSATNTDDFCDKGRVVVIDSVEFINSKKLKVFVTVDPEATTGKFNIEAFSSGRRGRGIEKFSVLNKNGDVALYSVLISMDVEGGSDTDQHWRGDFGGKNDIGLNDAVRGTLVGEFTNLSFFSTLFEGQGNNCFPSGLFMPYDLDPALTIHQGRVSQGKQGRAEAGFFFDGFTFDGGAVLATLKLIGTFATGEDWPPLNGSSSTLLITNWEMSVTNEGKAIKKISCIGKGDFEGGAGVTILVTNIEN